MKKLPNKRAKRPEPSYASKLDSYLIDFENTEDGKTVMNTASENMEHHIELSPPSVPRQKYFDRNEWLEVLEDPYSIDKAFEGKRVIKEMGSKLFKDMEDLNYMLEKLDEVPKIRGVGEDSGDSEEEELPPSKLSSSLANLSDLLYRDNQSSRAMIRRSPDAIHQICNDESPVTMLKSKAARSVFKNTELSATITSFNRNQGRLDGLSPKIVYDEGAGALLEDDLTKTEASHMPINASLDSIQFHSKSYHSKQNSSLESKANSEMSKENIPLSSSSSIASSSIASQAPIANHQKQNQVDERVALQPPLQPPLNQANSRNNINNVRYIKSKEANDWNLDSHWLGTGPIDAFQRSRQETGKFHEAVKALFVNDPPKLHAYQILCHAMQRLHAEFVRIPDFSKSSGEIDLAAIAGATIGQGLTPQEASRRRRCFYELKIRADELFKYCANPKLAKSFSQFFPPDLRKDWENQSKKTSMHESKAAQHHPSQTITIDNGKFSSPQFSHGVQKVDKHPCVKSSNRYGSPTLPTKSSLVFAHLRNENEKPRLSPGTNSSVTNSPIEHRSGISSMSNSPNEYENDVSIQSGSEKDVSLHRTEDKAASSSKNGPWQTSRFSAESIKLTFGRVDEELEVFNIALTTQRKKMADSTSEKIAPNLPLPSPPIESNEKGRQKEELKVKTEFVARAVVDFAMACQRQKIRCNLAHVEMQSRGAVSGFFAGHAGSEFETLIMSPETEKITAHSHLIPDYLSLGQLRRCLRLAVLTASSFTKYNIDRNTKMPLGMDQKQGCEFGKDMQHHSRYPSDEEKTGDFVEPPSYSTPSLKFEENVSPKIHNITAQEHLEQSSITSLHHESLSQPSKSLLAQTRVSFKGIDTRNEEFQREVASHNYLDKKITENHGEKDGPQVKEITSHSLETDLHREVQVESSHDPSNARICADEDGQNGANKSQHVDQEEQQNLSPYKASSQHSTSEENSHALKANTSDSPHRNKSVRDRSVSPQRQSSLPVSAVGLTPQHYSTQQRSLTPSSSVKDHVEEKTKSTSMSANMSNMSQMQLPSTHPSSHPFSMKTNSESLEDSDEIFNVGPESQGKDEDCSRANVPANDEKTAQPLRPMKMKHDLLYSEPKNLSTNRNTPQAISRDEDMRVYRKPPRVPPSVNRQLGIDRSLPIKASRQQPSGGENDQNHQRHGSQRINHEARNSRTRSKSPSDRMTDPHRHSHGQSQQNGSMTREHMLSTSGGGALLQHTSSQMCINRQSDDDRKACVSMDDLDLSSIAGSVDSFTGRSGISSYHFSPQKGARGSTM